MQCLWTKTPQEFSIDDFFPSNDSFGVLVLGNDRTCLSSPARIRHHSLLPFQSEKISSTNYVIPWRKKGSKMSPWFSGDPWGGKWWKAGKEKKLEAGASSLLLGEIPHIPTHFNILSQFPVCDHSILLLGEFLLVPTHLNILIFLELSQY